MTNANGSYDPTSDSDNEFDERIYSVDSEEVDEQIDAPDSSAKSGNYNGEREHLEADDAVDVDRDALFDDDIDSDPQSYGI